MRRVTIVLGFGAILYVGLAVLQACDNCEPAPTNQRIKSIHGEAQQITGITLSVDNAPSFLSTKPYQSSANGIRYDSIALEIESEVETFSFDAKGKFVAQAFACDPAPVYSNLKDISITSSEDYDPLYPKGSDLKGIMSIRQGYALEGIHISTFLPNTEFEFGQYLLTFDAPPSDAGTHNLLVKYSLAGGREFETTIVGVRINK